jgi:glycosyltransferase involved in cell wall biosynthesis
LLRRRVGRDGLDGAVRFLGERDDVPELLRAVDLLLVPSWEEPFGRAIVEAMAAGVPAIATDVGGPPEILAGGGGVVLPPRSPAAWSAAIGELLSDGERLAALGERARAAARARFGAERHAAAVIAVYEEALGVAAATAPL